MKEYIEDFNCKRVIVEPGDATRYDFIFVKNVTEFNIMPYKSSFMFPQKLSVYDVKDIINLETAIAFIEDNSPKYDLVNPHTLFQVCNILRNF